MVNILIQTLGGLGLFVLGMKLMTEGLQMAAGNRIRNILKAVSDNRLVGFATGAAVTAMVQSSSATTVMLISFVSAGLMTLTQAVGVILGCNVGTIMTAQLSGDVEPQWRCGWYSANWVQGLLIVLFCGAAIYAIFDLMGILPSAW